MKIKTLFYFFLFLATPLCADYVHIDTLYPGQIRFSSKIADMKATHALEKGDAFYDSSSDSYVGAYFNGGSFLSEKSSIPVVKSPVGYVLIDGHHAVIAALALELPWIPIKEVDDLSALSEATFWETAAANGWAHLYDLEGNKRFPPQHFTDLQDDPNRYFAAMTARKCPPDGDLTNSVGAEYPLWIKVGKDIPFIEFHISDVLLSNHFQYTYDMDYEDSTLVEQARAILLQANIPGLRVVPERKHFSELD